MNCRSCTKTNWNVQRINSPVFSKRNTPATKLVDLLFNWNQNNNTLYCSCDGEVILRADILVFNIHVTNKSIPQTRVSPCDSAKSPLSPYQIGVLNNHNITYPEIMV